MPVHNDMVSFPRVVRPALVMYETWQEFAERVGAAKFGVDWLTAHCLIVILGVGHGGAVIHRDLGGGRELALQCANDKKPHVYLLSVCSRLAGAYRQNC